MTNSDLPILKYSKYALKSSGVLQSHQVLAEDSEGTIWGAGTTLEECEKEATRVLAMLGAVYGGPSSIVELTFARTNLC